MSGNKWSKNEALPLHIKSKFCLITEKYNLKQAVAKYSDHPRALARKAAGEAGISSNVSEVPAPEVKTFEDNNEEKEDDEEIPERSYTSTNTIITKDKGTLYSLAILLIAIRREC